MQTQEQQYEDTYNGWTNWATWNCFCWMTNEEELYHLACKASMFQNRQYEVFTHLVFCYGPRKFMDYCDKYNKQLWTDPMIDRQEMNEAIIEMRPRDYRQEDIIQN